MPPVLHYWLWSNIGRPNTLPPVQFKTAWHLTRLSPANNSQNPIGRDEKYHPLDERMSGTQNMTSYKPRLATV